MYDLARAIVPLLDQPNSSNECGGACLIGRRLHLAVCYGGLTLPTQRQTASLAGWQRQGRQLMLDASLGRMLGSRNLPRRAVIRRSFQ